MSQKKVGLVGLIFWFIAFASCAVIMVPYNPQGTMSWEREVFRRTLSFPSGGRVDLSLKGGKADVEIAGQEEENLRATIFQGYPFTRRVFFAPANQARSPQVAIDASGSQVRLEVRGREKEIFPWRFKLEVPRHVELNQVQHEEGDIFIHDLFGSIAVNLGRGNLQIKNYSGSIEANVGRGNIEVEVLDIREGDTISLTTDEGDIVVFLENQASVEVQAQAPEGKIFSDFPASESSDHHLLAILGEGKANLILKAVKGNIKLRKIE